MSDTPWNTPINNPEWEQDFGNVKVVRNAVEGPLRDDLATIKAPLHERRARSGADETRLKILKNANDFISSAVDDLREAIEWFSVVDRADHDDLVRQVEGLADTIGYRLRNAGE